MPRTRWIALALLALVTLGSLGGTLGYAWYLRSDRYRESCSQSLSEALGLPSEIGRVVPRSRRSQEFRDIIVWLPERRGRAHTVERAVLTYIPVPGDPESYELELSGGSSEVSTRTWLRGDYRGVVESSLRPGFTEDGPRRVTFSGMNLTFERERFHVRVRGAAGSVAFESGEIGRAFIRCAEINGFVPAEPATLLAEFSPVEDGIRLDSVELRVRDVPIHVADLRNLAGIDVQSGRFEGTFIYHEAADQKRVTVSGRCSGVELSECTAGLTPTPWRGRCPELVLQELEVVNRQPQRIRFGGTLAGVSLGDILATWGIRDADATVSLNIGEADLTPDGIVRLVASGSCVDLPLEPLSRGLGYGAISGTLRVTINDLTIENNCIKSLEATLRVADAGDSPNWIETRLLREIASRVLKIPLPPIPLERIEYTKLGVRIEVHDEKLTVFGTHGERDQTILTARLLGRDMGLIGEPRDTFDLTAWFEQIRHAVAGRLRQSLGLLPTSYPTSAPAW